MKLISDAMTANVMIKYGKVLLLLGMVFGTLVALPRYGGSGYIYLIFSLFANTLLFFGFRKNANFFDVFIGVFFWIGFWLKLTVRILFFGGQFSEAVGDFNYTGDGYDHALLVSMCGLLGLIVASLFREFFMFTYSRQDVSKIDSLISELFKKYRISILSSFFFLFVCVAISNILFGIYQKGAITQTILPYGLSGVFKWLILFGLASFSALILKYELIAKKEISTMVIVLVLLESFSTNT